MTTTETAAGLAPQPFRSEDVVYRQEGGDELLARLYVPARPIAALVEIHGGGWTQGDRLTNAPLDAALAEAGILVMAADFRMPPKARYPAPIADIHYAIRWLKAHAPGLGIDPGKVGGLGLSSGAHQLLLAAMKPDDPRYAALPIPGEAAPDGALAFLVLCWPVADPLARYRMAIEKKLPLVDNHHAYWADEAEMAEGNPQLLLDGGAAVRLPPALLLQGTADDNLTPEMSPRFAASYQARGGQLRLEMFAGQPHAFFGRFPQSEETRRGIRLIAAFARQYGGS